VSNGSESEAILDRVLMKYERYPGKSTGPEATLEAALNNAYENGKVSGRKVFHVEEIFIVGDNPLSGYAVVISPHG
jgi:hypothetical protein